MLRAIQHHRLVPAGLTALIVLGIWGRAMAGIFCPHMIGGADCCLMQTPHTHPHAATRDQILAATGESMDHSQMSDMNMSDMAMDISGAHGEDVIASQPKADSELASNNLIEIASDNQLKQESIAQANNPCSHCLMHSQSGSNAPLSFVTQNNNSHRVIPAHLAMGIVKSAPSSLTFLDLHDHSPPNSSAPLYVLVNSFRI
jgi:hypothetical protein